MLTVVVALAVLFWAMAQLGDALGPALVKDQPYLLLLLNARLRNLVLVVNEVTPVYYYVVGTLRMLVSDPLFYLLGFWYGEAAVAWVEQRTPSVGRFVREYEKLFREASYVVMAVAPSSLVCVLAGSAGMHPVGFLVVNVLGTVARLILVDMVGAAFEEPLGTVTTWISDNRLFLLPITIGLVAVTVGRDLVRGRRDLSTLHELADEAGATDEGRGTPGDEGEDGAEEEQGERA